MTRSTAMWTRATLALAAAIAALAAMELIAQLTFRMQSGHWLASDTREKTSQNIPYTVAVRGPRDYALKAGYRDPVHHLSVDDDGFRVTVPAPKKNQRVVVNLGDSVPFGAGCRSDEDTYSSDLAALFARQNLDIGVVNAGVPSYNVRQSFDRFDADVLPLYGWSRVAAVTLNAANDVSLVYYYGDQYNADRTWARPRNFVGEPGRQRWALLHYASNGVDGYFKRTTAARPLPAGTSAADFMLSNVRELLHERLAQFDAHGVFVVLLPINPFYYQLAHQDRNAHLRLLEELYHGKLPEMEQWDGLIRRFNDVLREVAGSCARCSYLETRQTFDERDRNDLYADWIHFGPAGSALMADALAADLARHGRLGINSH